MAGPGVFAMNVYQGDSYRWDFVLWLDDEKTQPVDLTETRAEATIRIGEQRIALPTEIVPPNTVVLTLPADISAHLAGNGLWDLRLIKPNSEVQTLVRGSVSVMAGVSVGSADASDNGELDA